MKKLLIITLLFGCSLCTARAQSIAFPDMADLLNLSIPQIENVLVGTGKFKVNNKQDVYGQIMVTYQSIDKDQRAVKGESIVTGGYRTTADGGKLHTLTYNSIYHEYVDNLMKQIKKYGYRLTFKGNDPLRYIYIFDNQVNHITVYMRTDHTLNSVEIKQKEIGVE